MPARTRRVRQSTESALSPHGRDRRHAESPGEPACDSTSADDSRRGVAVVTSLRTQSQRLDDQFVGSRRRASSAIATFCALAAPIVDDYGQDGDNIMKVPYGPSVRPWSRSGLQTVGRIRRVLAPERRLDRASTLTMARPTDSQAGPTAASAAITSRDSARLDARHHRGGGRWHFNHPGTQSCSWVATAE
jgi:hypothetical protein